jgi:hypothetical protein
MDKQITFDARARSRRDFFAKASAFFAAAGVAPMLKAQTPTSDLDILNFALRLERLEASFYTQGLAKFSAADIAASQFAQNFGPKQVANVYTNLQQIQQHETTHVMQISAAIMQMGGTPAATDCYGFQPYGGDLKTFKTADTFIAVAMTLENTGVMAYDGAIALVQSAALRTTAATIATVEARHAAYLNELNGVSPFPAAFDTPGSATSILTAAASFLAPCSMFPPTAVAGPKGQTTSSKTFQLDGSASVTTNGQPIVSYVWETVLGNNAAVANASFPKPTVTFLGGPGIYTFTLMVTDANGNNGVDVVKVNYTGT